MNRAAGMLAGENRRTETAGIVEAGTVNRLEEISTPQNASSRLENVAPCWTDPNRKGIVGSQGRAIGFGNQNGVRASVRDAPDADFAVVVKDAAKVSGPVTMALVAKIIALAETVGVMALQDRRGANKTRNRCAASVVCAVNRNAQRVVARIDVVVNIALINKGQDVGCPAVGMRGPHPDEARWEGVS